MPDGADTERNNNRPCLHARRGVGNGGSRRFIFAVRFFSKICKTPPKGHCLRNFRRAIAGKQALLLTDNFIRRNLMRKTSKMERVILDQLRQGYRPKSHSADIVPQLRNNTLASCEPQKSV
jgi:hypothetical protein